MSQSRKGYVLGNMFRLIIVLWKSWHFSMRMIDNYIDCKKSVTIYDSS